MVEKKISVIIIKTGRIFHSFESVWARERQRFSNSIHIIRNSAMVWQLRIYCCCRSYMFHLSRFFYCILIILEKNNNNTDQQNEAQQNTEKHRTHSCSAHDDSFTHTHELTHTHGHSNTKALIPKRVWNSHKMSLCAYVILWLPKHKCFDWFYCLSIFSSSRQAPSVAWTGKRCNEKRTPLYCAMESQ